MAPLENPMKLALAVILALASGAAAAESCAPSSNAARILSKPAPNAVHPDWSGDSYVGLSWSFETTEQVEQDDITYLKGDLISPRGGVVNEGVYILADEWDCE